MMSGACVDKYTLPGIERCKEKAIKQPIPNREYVVKNVKHVIPNAKFLKSKNGGGSGELDLWPAYSESHTYGPHVALSQNKRMVLINESHADKVSHKPRFLYELEKFLETELVALNATDVKANELRLQAHREVFGYLIEDFRSYRPLLSSIKNEYEMMLAQQRDKIKELEPLKQILVNVSEECDHKIMSLRDSEKERVQHLRNENEGLQKNINCLNNEIQALNEQVSGLQEKLRIQYEKYRFECDSRKILIADMNNLKHQQEDHIFSQESKDNVDQERNEDPVTLKIALKQARHDEKRVSVKLNEMFANYGDVIPRRDFEKLEKKYQVLNDGYETLNVGFQKMQIEYNALLELQEQTRDQRDNYYLQLEELKRTATPRPEWVNCADYIDGGQEKWNSLTEQLSSNEIMHALLNEISSGTITSGGLQFFDSLGLDGNIPKYLRHDGPVKNRYLTKRDCLIAVLDIWKERVDEEQEGKPEDQVALIDFLYTYLQKRYPVPPMAIEWGYSLRDGLTRFKDRSPILALFSDILNGDVDEQVYHRQLQDISLLLTHLSVNDTSDDSSLTKTEFRKLLQQFFNGVSEDRISELCETAAKELELESEDKLLYKNLFMEDDEGNVGPFIDMFKDICMEQKTSFINDILVQLGEISPVMLDDFTQAIAFADPDIDQDTMDRYCEWVFAGGNDQHGLEVDAIRKRLKNGDIWKTSHIKVFYEPGM